MKERKRAGRPPGSAALTKVMGSFTPEQIAWLERTRRPAQAMSDRLREIIDQARGREEGLEPLKD